MENLISECFLITLSSFHYLITPNKNRMRLYDPETSSFLYNYSLALNESMSSEDAYYKTFNYWGYPADTYAVHFVKNRPYFSFYL